MRKTLFRAANDDYIAQGMSFAESRETAEAYLDNPGFGGASVWRAKIEVTRDDVIDLTGDDVSDVARLLGMSDPGAIGLDEWLPRTVSALDALRESGKLWAKVRESFPTDTTTWIWLGTSLDDEPTLEVQT